MAQGRWFARGDNLTEEEIQRYMPKDAKGRPVGGWFVTDRGQSVYACNGAHKDGSTGFKVLDLNVSLQRFFDNGLK